ncbi:MAG: hypothetical protein A2W26_00565 [Acidobacteria bacterium RBG_16_64_8]|nr:MAG: hypothetical protein A2W26_00565 [Acidobacteria bacterium RBG_16_64_8]
MSGPRYIFHLGDVPEGVTLESVYGVPGVWPLHRDNSSIIVPLNAGWLIEGELRRLGVPYRLDAASAPNPLPTLPRLPGIRDSVYALLANHQRDAICWSIPRDGALFWHPCGSGKSLTCLCRAAAHHGMAVVVTRAVGRGHWAEEIARYTTEKSLIVTHPLEARADLTAPFPGRTLLYVALGDDRAGIACWRTAAAVWRDAGGVADVRILDSVRKFKRGIWRVRWQVGRMAYLGRGKGGYTFTPATIVEEDAPKYIILTWETLAANVSWLKGLAPETVVYDECHRAKQHKRYVSVPRTVKTVDADGVERVEPVLDETTGDLKMDFVERTNTSMAAKNLSKVCKVRIGATATPIRDRMRDFWAQLDLLFPFQYGSFKSFAIRHCNGHSTTYAKLDSSGSSNTEELRARLSFDVHYVPKSVSHANLPPKRREFTFVDPEDFRELGTAERAELTAEYKAAGPRGPGALAEVCLAEAAAQKRDVVIDMVADALDSGQKVLVFTSRRREVAAIAGALRKRAKKLPRGTEIWATHGADSGEEREAIRKEYMAHPGPCALIATGDSCGEVANLQSTDLHLIVQLPWNSSQIEQWEGRSWRLGSDRSVIYRYVIAKDTQDVKVAAVLLDKIPHVESIGKEHAVDVSTLRESLEREGKSLDELNATLVSKITEGVVCD